MLLHAVLLASLLSPAAALRSAVGPPLLQRPLRKHAVVATEAAEPADPAITVPQPVGSTGMAESPGHAHVTVPGWLAKLGEYQELGVGSVVLIAATVVSLALANLGATSSGWLGLWATSLGPPIGGHQLSLRGWINEGLMAVFFFLVGLEIKQELRCGSLATVRTAVLPCIAAVGGMVTPMLIYLLVQGLLPMGSLAALTVPMATDIAFAMAIFGLFRKRMPPSSSAFLLTLATVDDLGAIIVLATCFAHGVAPLFLLGAAGLCAALTAIGRSKVADLKVFAAGGAALWWCLLSAGVNADVAGVIAALCISTKAVVPVKGQLESLSERIIARLAPLSTFVIMPLFALANTAVRLGGGDAAGAAASLAPAVGIGAGLLIGKPLGIFAFTWLATKLGLASMPAGMNNQHLAITGMLGGIGFTMCLLLTEVALPASWHALPKLVVLASSAVASIVAAIAMAKLPVLSPKAS